MTETEKRIVHNIKRSYLALSIMMDKDRTSLLYNYVYYADVAQAIMENEKYNSMNVQAVLSKEENTVLFSSIESSIERGRLFRAALWGENVRIPKYMLREVEEEKNRRKIRY